MSGYISLSFSYMTYVINKTMSQKNSYENTDYLFDIEQYNYLIEKRTALANQVLINDT